MHLTLAKSSACCFGDALQHSTRTVKWFLCLTVAACSCRSCIKGVEPSLLCWWHALWRSQTAHFGGNSPSMCYQSPHDMTGISSGDRGLFRVAKQAHTWECIYTENV